MTAVGLEVDYQYAIWDGRYVDALDSARSVLGTLNASELRGYRALWNYFAGNAAWLAIAHGQKPKSSEPATYYATAQKSVSGIRWLSDLGRYAEDHEATSTGPLPAAVSVIERLETVIEKQGTANNHRFDQAEARVLKGIMDPDGVGFEASHEELGKLLGYEAGKVEADATPDPWWRADDSFCFVFEDHAGAKAKGMVDATKARQAATHKNWIRQHIPLNSDAAVIQIMLTPVTRATSGATPHIKAILVWPLDDFRDWARTALSLLRELRKTFVGVGDLEWRAKALDAFERKALSPEALRVRLVETSAKVEWEEIA